MLGKKRKVPVKAREKCVNEVEFLFFFLPSFFFFSIHHASSSASRVAGGGGGGGEGGGLCAIKYLVPGHTGACMPN